jgi:nicotinate-nucleotide--dimethylbenzimidazole phosphoribosyltransferase
MSPLDDFARLAAGEHPGPQAPQATGESDGPLADIAAWLTAWSGRAPAQVLRPVLALYAASDARTLGLEPGAVHRARARLEAIAAGAAPVAAAARRLGAGLEAFDLAVERPVGDIGQGPAMSERECAATLAFGMEALSKSPDLLLVGEVAGAGPVTAAALGAALSDAEPPPELAPVIAEAREAAVGQPLQLLRRLGGRHLAAMTGAIMAARVQQTPVLLDGYGSAVAAAVLHALRPGLVEHCRAAHAESAEHARLLARLGLRPMLNVALRDSEGVGALAALSLVQVACAAQAG